MGWKKMSHTEFHDSAERGIKSMAKRGDMSQDEAESALEHIADERKKGDDGRTHTWTVG